MEEIMQGEWGCGQAGAAEPQAMTAVLAKEFRYVWDRKGIVPLI